MSAAAEGVRPLCRKCGKVRLNRNNPGPDCAYCQRGMSPEEAKRHRTASREYLTARRRAAAELVAAPLAAEAVPRDAERGDFTRLSITVSRKSLRRIVAAAAPLEAGDLSALAERPRLRADCAGGARPCPYVGCKFHLYLDVTHCGSITFNWPGQELEQLRDTCALDVADRGGVTLEEVGAILNLTRERVRQIEGMALRTAKDKLNPEDE